MILKGWHIDGFGIFHDERKEDLGSGVTVICGSNEAGKSTLLAFIRGVLFGFPDKRSKGREPLYEPLRGGAHGGRLFVESGGERYTIARRAGSRNNPATITDEAGVEIPERDLTQLLGGADATLFRNVFGFSLSELQEPRSLTEDSVRDRIFSLAVAGAGRSARDAAKGLRDVAARRYKPDGRARSNRVFDLLRELGDIKGDLAYAKSAAEAYPETIEAERAAEDSVRQTRERIAALRHDLRELESLLRLWPEWCKREVALTHLEEAAGRTYDRRQRVAPEASFADLAGTALELARRVEVQHERLGRAAELRANLKGASERLNTALEELGEDWTEERAAAFRMTIPTREEIRQWELSLAEAERTAGQAEEEARTSRRARDEAAAETEKRARERDELGEPPAETGTLREQRTALEVLKDRVGELERQRQAVDHAHALAEEREKRVDDLRGRRGGGGMLAVTIVLAIGGLAFFASAAVMLLEPTVAVGLAGAFLLAAAASAWRGRRARLAADAAVSMAERELEDARQQEEAAGNRRDELAMTVAEEAKTLWLEAAPGVAEVTRAMGEVDRKVDLRRHWDSRDRACRDAEDVLKRREESLDSAEGARQAADEGLQARYEMWKTWKAEHGFPEHLSATGVLDFADRIGAARAIRQEKQELGRALSDVAQAIASWEAEARQVLAERSKPDDLEGEALVAAFEMEAAAIEEENERYRTIATVEAALVRESGSNSRAWQALSGRLAAGDANTWESEREELAASLDREGREEEDAVRRHEAARREREAVEVSDRIADLETRKNAIEAEIREAHREWQVATAARVLIEETLDAFERERQPAVFAHAGESFARITGTRYPRIVQDESGEGLYVLDRSDRRVDPINLSRGTREQLYLAIRLGLVDEFSRRGTSLPLIMDEILVNFDPRRMEAVAREIGNYGAEHQVLLFTCHPFVVDQVRATNETATVVEI